MEPTAPDAAAPARTDAPPVSADEPLAGSTDAVSGPTDARPDRRIQLPRLAVPAGAGHAWRKALREFAVIVAGVLAAQTAQAWWAAGQDRDRERDYLRQLLADTRANQERLDDAIRQDSLAGVANGRAIDALTRTGPLAPADSVARWVMYTGASSYFIPLSGTFRALLGTGDLRLVRNDSLRARIAAYATLLDSETERQRDLRQSRIGSAGPFAREFPFIRRVFLHDAVPATANVAALRANPDALAVLFSLQAANANGIAGLRSMRKATREMRRALEAEPALRDAK